jgi:hypothetical protein
MRDNYKKVICTSFQYPNNKWGVSVERITHIEGKGSRTEIIWYSGCDGLTFLTHIDALNAGMEKIVNETSDK